MGSDEEKKTRRWVVFLTFLLRNVRRESSGQANTKNSGLGKKNNKVPLTSDGPQWLHPANQGLTGPTGALSPNCLRHRAFTARPGYIKLINALEAR
jgi:hypothetical protein